jgi:hypothetical protein
VPARLTGPAPLLYQGRRCPLCITRRKFLPAPSSAAGRRPAAGAGRDGQPGGAVTVLDWPGGRCIMSRSGVFYAVKAMERPAAGDAPGVPAKRAADHQVAAAAHPDGSTWSFVRRVLAALRGRIGQAIHLSCAVFRNTLRCPWPDPGGEWAPGRGYPRSLVHLP